MNRSPITLDTSAASKLHGQEHLLGNLNLQVAPGDGMFMSNHAHYLAVGANALALVLDSLAAAGRKKPVRSILDYACGHGRVIRWLQAAFPNAVLIGADANFSGAQAVRELFGIQVEDVRLPDLPDFGRKFDVIWVGSLITHLREQATKDLVAYLAGLLEPQGVLVITMCGIQVERELRNKKPLGLKDDEVETLLRDLNCTGYGFGLYPRAVDYGLAICRPSKFLSYLEAAGLRPAMFRESAWDGRQDVAAAVKPG